MTMGTGCILNDTHLIKDPGRPGFPAAFVTFAANDPFTSNMRTFCNLQGHRRQFRNGARVMEDNNFCTAIGYKTHW